MKHRLAEFQNQTEGQTVLETLAWALKTFGAPDLVLASSMGAEDQMLTHYLLGLEPKARVFTLDTGRHFQETYDLMAATERAYNFRYESYFPEASDVEELLAAQGANGFYRSVAARQACCRVRKVLPLQRALAGAKAWITGQRREQGLTRTSLERVEWDAGNGLFKINPLVDWTEATLWEALGSAKVPTHALHAHSYPSIGCQPCTRAVAPGEDLRSGRWWWEEPEHKECGLHHRPQTA
ncbi:MAG: phosphoadenylyl-sulfate reductase [bacterium]|nr:phosphoadenylyl-sulfate reductase [bacterium]